MCTRVTSARPLHAQILLSPPDAVNVDSMRVISVLRSMTRKIPNDPIEMLGAASLGPLWGWTQSLRLPVPAQANACVGGASEWRDTYHCAGYSFQKLNMVSRELQAPQKTRRALVARKTIVSPGGFKPLRSGSALSPLRCAPSAASGAQAVQN